MTAHIGLKKGSLEWRKSCARMGARDMRGIIKSYGKDMSGGILEAHIRHREDALSTGKSVNPDYDRGTLIVLLERQLELVREQLP